LKSQNPICFTLQECTLTFPGTKAFSEVESQAISDLVTKYNASLHTYLAVHTYGNYVLYPYGYSFGNLISNWKEHHAVGDQFAGAVKNYSGQKYQVGNSAALLYPAYGASDDYVASRGARLAYTLELTGGGMSGFDLPAHKMGEVAAETFEGFKVIAHNAKKTHL
jgi:carboxypeptidase A1